MLGVFTFAHPFVDACSMGVLIAGGMTWRRILAYNAIAFALQLPVGILADARPGMLRNYFFCGTALVLAAALCAILGFAGWGVLAAACLGNALFHLAAGKDVLETYAGRSGPIGLFISTGALGLLASRIGMGRCADLALPVFAAGIAAAMLWTALRLRKPDLRSVMRSPLSPSAALPRNASLSAWVLAGLFVLVAWRSCAGLMAGYLSSGQGTSMLFAGAAVTWAGKALGGVLAGPFGRGPVTLASVCGSAALAFLCPPGLAAVWLVLLFVAQLATGPVLSLLYDRSGRRGGLSFGLNCLALFLGSLA